MRDGNLSDKTWNGQAIDAVGDLLTPQEREQVIYVADSACVTQDNLRRLASAQMSFISRLPATFGLVDELKSAVLEAGAWAEVGTLRKGKDRAAYKVQSFERPLYGRTYRFIVVHSSHLAQQKQKTLQRKAQREHQDVTDTAEELTGKTFSCRADAERAAQEFLAEHEGLYALHTEVREVVETKRRPGRPKAGEKPVQITTYRVAVTVGDLQTDLLQGLQDEQSLFILVTNLRDEANYPPEAVLQEYKEQASVEVRFRFLKDPAFVDGFFVKDTGRLEALAYLMLVALLVYALIERMVRLGLRKDGQMLIGAGGVKHEAPTGRVVLTVLSPIEVLFMRGPGGVHRYLSDLDASQRFVLDLLGIRPEDYVNIAAYVA